MPQARFRFVLTLAGLAALAAGGSTMVCAESAPAVPVPAGAASAVAAPDPTGIWTLSGENSSISTSSLTDRYYVNGLRLGYTSATTNVPSLLQDIARTVLGAGQTRWSFDITQQIFTAADTEAFDPPQHDRPYAGLLLGNVALQQDTLGTRSTLGLSLGMVGPSALGQSVQNGFHDIIGQATNNGWGTQLHDEPVFEVLASRVWRFPTWQVGSLETDVLPDASVGLGTVRVYGEAGAQFRLGQGLDSDFGVARLRPGPSGGDSFVPTRPFAWYVFAGGNGQLVGHDVTLNGNTWQDSRSVPIIPVVGEAQIGLAVMAWGTRLSYTQVFQSQEFKRQKDGLHQFGALALSVRF